MGDLGKLLNTAFKLFHEKKYAEAGRAFDDILAATTEFGLKSRILQFKMIADSHLSQKPSVNKDSLLVEVAYLLNLGRHDEADKKAAEAPGDNDLTHYLRAEIAAERGELEKACDFLEKAIEINSDNRGYAWNSSSFSALANHERFLLLRGSQGRTT